MTTRAVPRSGARRRTPVAVLGATGMVGQTFVRLLAEHPWFEITALAASERSEGRRYADAVRWTGAEWPARIAALPVVPCDPRCIEAPIVFSALDAEPAADLEPCFAAAGRLVLTNARTARLDPDVPLVIPEINADHLELLAAQRALRGWTGAIIANANCATIVLALALAPLHEAFGVRQVMATTLQAVSGAGYPGVPSLDILGNIIPFIGGGEEEKIETETRKIFGTREAARIEPAPFAVSAQVNRVPVEHGHTVCLAVALERPAAPEDAAAAIAAWRGAVGEMGLPSAPMPPVRLASRDDRPQPRHDAGAGGGMAITVGRIRRDPVLDLKMVALGHNLVRGAAGASILNAELVLAREGHTGEVGREGALA